MSVNFLRTEFNKRIKTLKLDEQAKEKLFDKFKNCWGTGFRCFYCKKRMEMKWGSELSFTIDHIVPRKFKGLGIPDNLTFVCRTCNFLKGDKQPDWFFRNVKRLKLRKEKQEYWKARKATKKDEQTREAYKGIFEMGGC